VVQPAPPPKPKPVVPTPPAVIPPPAATPTPPAPIPTPSPTPGITPTPSAPPPPAPGHAVLNAAGPAEPITLIPGQGAVNLPLTIRNTGDAPSDPVTAVLHLPPGVSALGNATQLGSHSLDSQRIGKPRPPHTPE